VVFRVDYYGEVPILYNTYYGEMSTEEKYKHYLEDVMYYQFLEIIKGKDFGLIKDHFFIQIVILHMRDSLGKDPYWIPMFTQYYDGIDVDRRTAFSYFYYKIQTMAMGALYTEKDKPSLVRLMEFYDVGK
jgi:hypothetical protein